MINPLMTAKIEEILSRFPLRVSITDNCNLACFICSIEGLGLDQRNTKSVDPKDFRFLVDTLTNKGLNHISLSGGDPTAHPNAREMIDIVNESGVENRFYHTNGILLAREELSGGLMDFTKIGVSAHAFNYENYQRITRGSRAQYDQVMRGLRMLGERGLGQKVEVKHVTVKGMNDDLDSIRETMDFCAEYGFKFKFLNFEAIEPSHVDLTQDVGNISERVRSLGATPIPGTMDSFRGQSVYIPITWYDYKGTRGVTIEVGCGVPEVCASCHDSNEIYVTPSLEIKACKSSDRVFPLKPGIDSRDENAILDAVVESREFLKTKPGQNREYWSKR